MIQGWPGCANRKTPITLSRASKALFAPRPRSHEQARFPTAARLFTLPLAAPTHHPDEPRRRGGSCVSPPQRGATVGLFDGRRVEDRRCGGVGQARPSAVRTVRRHPNDGACIRLAFRLDVSFQLPWLDADAPAGLSVVGSDGSRWHHGGGHGYLISRPGLQPERVV